MICTQCGSFNPDHATYCGRCGGQLTNPSYMTAPNPMTAPDPMIASNPMTAPDPMIASNPITSYYPMNSPNPPQNNVMLKSIPIWMLIGSIVLVAVLLIALQLTGSDWAAGAMRVGIVASILALIILLFTAVRLIVGMVTKSNSVHWIRLVSAVLVILLLLLISLVGLTQQSTIHNLQGHSWEGQQLWQSAINQYQLSGEGAPTSENIARVYNLWGEQFTSHQQFEEALAKYNIVLTYYGSASTGIARAQSDSISTYIAWGQQASQQHDYTAATNHFDTLLKLPYCAAACQSQANALDATAYYNLAESQLAASNYSDAVNNFHIVVTRFANSTEASKLHEDYAKALFGEGKQKLNGALCSTAIPTYQQLSSQFGDTPEGQQATSALKANQPVKGHFITAVPNDPALSPIATLIKGLNHSMSDSQFFQLLSISPTAKIQSNGDFLFSPLPQGTYGLAWGTNNSDGDQHFQYRYNPDGSSSYVANVGPLCPYDFGDLNETIPTS